MGRSIEGRPARLRLPKHVKAYQSNDKTYYYFRGTKVRLPGLPWSREFMDVHSAMMAERTPIGSSRTLAGTVNAAVAAYFASSMFTQGIGEITRKKQRPLVDRFRQEHGDKRIRMLEPRHLQAYVSAQKTPSTQRNMLRSLRHFLKFCVHAGLIATDPSDGVTRQRIKSIGGFHAWTEEQYAQFCKHHLPGSQARLALALYLNLGVRKSDVVRIGPRHIKDGELTDFQPKKTERSNGKKITVPLLPETLTLIKAMPLTGTDTFLVTAFGKPFTVNGFGNKMRDWCNQAGLPDCASHGLRKLCLTRLAEAGCDAFQIAAVSGHKDLKEVQHYVDAADRKGMAREAMAALGRARK